MMRIATDDKLAENLALCPDRRKPTLWGYSLK